MTEFLIPLRSVAIFSTIALIPLVLNRVDLFHGHQTAVSWGPLWFWVSLVLMIVAHKVTEVFSALPKLPNIGR